MKGIHFVIDESGEAVAVQIDLKEHGDLWEDFYDVLMIEQTKDEPRMTLEEFTQELIAAGKLREKLPSHSQQDNS